MNSQKIVTRLCISSQVTIPLPALEVPLGLALYSRGSKPDSTVLLMVVGPCGELSTLQLHFSLLKIAIG